MRKNLPGTVSKGLTGKKVQDLSEKFSSGFFKMLNGEAYTITFLREVSDLWNLEQVFKWFGEGKSRVGCGWTYTGSKDPVHRFEDAKKTERFVVPILVQDPDSKGWVGPLVWMQSRRFAERLQQTEENTEQPLTSQVFKVSRVGDGFDTDYVPTPLGRPTPELSEYDDFDELEPLEPFDVVGVVKYLEERLGMTYKQIVSTFGDGKEVGDLLEENSSSDDIEDFEEI